MKQPLSMPETVQILGISVPAILKRLRCGSLTGVLISGRAWLISRESVDGKRHDAEEFRRVCRETWVSVPEACNLVGVTDAMVIRMILRGELKGRRLNGTSWIVDRRSCEENLRQYLESPKRGGQPRRLGEDRNATSLRKARDAAKTKKRRLPSKAAAR